MGKNNRCKGKKKKQRDAQHFSITPKEIRQAEAQYNSHIQHYVNNVNWIFSIINEFILVDTFRFSKTMMHKFIDARRAIVGNIPSEDENEINAESLVDMYRHIEAVVGTETMTEWFGECPDPEEMKMGGN